MFLYVILISTITTKTQAMKHGLLFLIVILSCNLYGQSFYKSYSKPDFKSLLENGVYFLKTGDSIKDLGYISAIENNWEVTEVTILDSLDSSQEFSGQEIFFAEAKMAGDNSRILGLIQLNHIVKKEFSKYSFVGFIAFNGYDQKKASLSRLLYLDQTISGLNDIVQSIQDNEISKIGTGLYKSIYTSFLPKSKPLQSKTLLIIGNTKNYVNTSALKKAGIKFKLISPSEYETLKNDDLSDYCLMYFAYNTFTEISIYNLENNDLIYTRHFANGKAKFTSSDISAMKKFWE
jgi:hypothetical protein